MDAITLKSIAGEFLGTLGQSAVLTAMLHNMQKGKEPEMLMLVAAVTITVVIFHYWSSAKMNPFISIGVTLTSQNPDWILLLTDLVAQIAGGICGVYLTMKLLDIKVETSKKEEDYVTKNRLRTIISDAIFTFALVLSFVALVSDFKQGLLVGIGVALVYAASMIYQRGRSGGNINFSNRLGIAVATRDFSNLFVYTVGPLVGAILAVCGWYLYKQKFVSLFGFSCAQIVPATVVTETVLGETEAFQIPDPDEEPEVPLEMAHGHSHMGFI